MYQALREGEFDASKISELSREDFAERLEKEVSQLTMRLRHGC